MAGKWNNTRENLTDKGMYTLPIRGRFTNILLGTTPGDPNILATYIASKAPDAITTAEEVALANEGRSPEEIDAQKMMTVFPMGKFLRYDNPDFPGEPEFFDPYYDVVPASLREKCTEVVLPFMLSHQFEGKCKEAIYALRSADRTAKAAVEKSEEPETPKEEAPAEDAPKKRGRKPKGTAKPKASGQRFAASSVTAYKKTVDLGFFCVQRRVPILVAPTYIDDMGNEIETYNTPYRKGKLPVFVRPLRTEGINPRVCINASEFVPAGSEFYLTFKLQDPRMKQVLLEVLDYSVKVGMLQWRSSGKGTFIWTPADVNGHPVDEIPD